MQLVAREQSTSERSAWAKREPAAQVDAILYRATLARERGDSAAAGDLLRAAIPAAGQDRRKVLAGE